MIARSALRLPDLAGSQLATGTAMVVGMATATVGASCAGRAEADDGGDGDRREAAVVETVDQATAAGGRSRGAWATPAVGGRRGAR